MPNCFMRALSFQTYHVFFQNQEFVYDVLDVGTDGSVCQKSVSLENKIITLDCTTSHLMGPWKFNLC